MRKIHSNGNAGCPITNTTNAETVGRLVASIIGIMVFVAITIMFFRTYAMPIILIVVIGASAWTITNVWYVIRRYL